ncbi:MAG: hypothetical protein PHR77_10275, partial [Kiritimatiellae bacterium]|nr:hypothetical protein [Kiritimatiellia bacterium]
MTSINKMLLLGAFFCLTIVSAEEEATFKTYPLLTSDTNTIFEVVRAITGDKGKIFLYRPANELLISATSNQHAQISALLKEINIPSPNIRIDIAFLQTGKETDFGVGATGKGNVKVEQNKTSYQVEFKPYIRGQSTIITDNNNQTVVVKSGKQASIFMGHEVPF